MIKPKIPKYYYHTHIAVYASCFIMGVGLNLLSDRKWLDLVGLLIACSFPVAIVGFIYRAYYKESQQYASYKCELKAAASDKARMRAAKLSKVNGNIDSYLSEQRLKKQNSKWWQFWI